MAAPSLDNNRIGRTSPNRKRLFLAVTLVAASVLILAFRIRQILAPTNERLFLSANVNLAPPPKVTTDDRNETAGALKDVQVQAELTRREPKNGQAFLDLASKAIRANDPLTVRNSLSTAIALGGEVDATMLDSLGQAEIDLGLGRAALKTYQTVISRFPRDITGYLGLAHAHSALNEHSEALATLQRGEAACSDSDPSVRLALSREYDKRNSFEPALAQAEKAVQASHGSPESLLAAAGLQMKLNRVPQAEEAVARVIKAEPASSLAHRMMGQILISPKRHSRDLRQAEHHFLTALQINPKDSNALEGLGQICMEQKRYREAAFAYGNMIKAVPDVASARIQASRAYEQLGDAKTASEQRAVAATLVARKDGEVPLTTARDRNRTDVSARLKLAAFYMDCGKYSKALPEIDVADLRPEMKAQTRSLKARFYSALGLAPTDSK